MKRWLWIVLLIVVATVAPAGELKLTWDGPAPDTRIPAGYRVAWGTTPPPTNVVDVGNVLLWTKSDLIDCTPHYFHVTAYDGTAESAPSVEVSTYPRPDITLVQDSEIGTQAILGNNFDVNVKVFYDAGQGFIQLPPQDVTRVSCGELRIPDIALNFVKVANVATPLGSGEPTDIFSQPWPGPSGVAAN